MITLYHNGDGGFYKSCLCLLLRTFAFYKEVLCKIYIRTTMGSEGEELVWQEVTRSAHIRAPIKSLENMGMWERADQAHFRGKGRAAQAGGIVHVLIATQVEDLLFKSSANSLTACFSF